MEKIANRITAGLVVVLLLLGVAVAGGAVREGRPVGPALPTAPEPVAPAGGGDEQPAGERLRRVSGTGA